MLNVKKFMVLNFFHLISIFKTKNVAKYAVENSYLTGKNYSVGIQGQTLDVFPKKFQEFHGVS